MNEFKQFDAPGGGEWVGAVFLAAAFVIGMIVGAIIW